MKKILNLILTISVLGLFIIACENAISPENQAVDNNIALSKSGKSNAYKYELTSPDPLSASYGRVLFRLVEYKKYSFILNAYNLKPGIEYELESNTLPIEIVFPYVSTKELTATANRAGNLQMRGTINLGAGETLYIFTVTAGIFKMILRTEEIEL